MSMFTTLCNIVEQISDLEMNLDSGSSRRLGGNRVLNGGFDKTFFAPNNNAFKKNSDLGFDFWKEDFNQDEKAILKRLIQTLIIGGNQVLMLEDLENACEDNAVYTNFNAEPIGIQCKTNSNTGKINKFLYRADRVQVGISGPKIISDQNLLASNGNLLVVNDLLLF